MSAATRPSRVAWDLTASTQWDPTFAIGRYYVAVAIMPVLMDPGVLVWLVVFTHKEYIWWYYLQVWGGHVTKPKNHHFDWINTTQWLLFIHFVGSWMSFYWLFPSFSHSCLSRRCGWVSEQSASMWRGPAVQQSARFLSLWMPDRLSIWLLPEDVCRYVGTFYMLFASFKRNKSRALIFAPISLFHVHSVLSCHTPCSSTFHRTSTPLLCLPTLPLLFIILRGGSCCCFPGSAAGFCSSQWNDRVSCCRALPLPLPLLLLLFVIHCVVTFIIMDSAQVFRLSSGSWSPHTLLDMHRNTHRHVHA